MNLYEYALSLPDTLGAFYRQARTTPPFDVEGNPMGFRPENPRAAPPEVSCQSALLPILEYLASLCSTVAETGCREGYSTAAILTGLARNRRGAGSLVSYDRVEQPVVARLRAYALPPGVSWRWERRDVLTPDPIPAVDWLHVDDLHECGHVRRELEIHGGSALKYLSFHDTVSQGEHSLDCNGSAGINPAVRGYCPAHGFELILDLPFNHGLQVWERVTR